MLRTCTASSKWLSATAASTRSLHVALHCSRQSMAASVTTTTTIGSLKSCSIRSFSAMPTLLTNVATTTTNTDNKNNNEKSKEFKVAIIGSGPGGFYTAHRIFKNIPEAQIDMFEALPVPHGLVRFGVAPDHPEVKNVINTFDEVAQNPQFSFIGNTRVGSYTTSSSSSSSSSSASSTTTTPTADLEISDLIPHYHAIVLAYGAHQDRILGIPHEQGLDRAKGVFAARSFVGFYNGLPSEQFILGNDLENQATVLQQTDTAVVIGQGNVALDIARILLSPLKELKKTDLTEKAIKVLSKSTIKHVYVMGRRGPLEVSFTAKELREMLQLDGVSFKMDQELLEKELKRAEEMKSLDRPRKRLMGLLQKGIKESVQGQEKSWSLGFLQSPAAFLVNDDNNDGNRTLKGIEVGLNRLEDSKIPGGPRKAVDTGMKQVIDCGVAFRSIGYKSVGIQGIPFDERQGIVPNLDGKVIQDLSGAGKIVPGYYVSGWLKRGPVGVIATTMADAYQTADTIIADWKSHQPMLQSNTEEDDGSRPKAQETRIQIRDLLKAKGKRPVSYQDWKKIEQKEFDRGQALGGKPREKFLTVEEMLAVLD